MRAGKNVWHCDYCGAEVKGPKDGNKPDQCACGGPDYWIAKFSESRVDTKRGVYEYYRENTPWDRSANDAMRRAAKEVKNYETN